MRKLKPITLLFIQSLLLFCLVSTPATAAPGKVDFDKDIKPILKNRCSRCHSGHKRKGGFSIDSRAAFLQEGESGPAVVAGKGKISLLVELITSKDSDERMPSKGKPLTPEEINLFRAWIDQGLTWPEGFSFTQWARAPMAPRKVELPPGEAKENPVDRLVRAYWKNKKPPTQLKQADDRTFARRVWLDLVGTLPPVDELEAFVGNRAPNKRAQLVNRLLADKQAYAEHWLTFWSDMLRNAYRGTGFIDGGRKQITQWLYGALHSNMPYDQFVRELISPAKGSEGFINGIKWRGVVSAAQRREVQAAQNISQVFLGTNLKCASCHDSFINHWRIADTWALASVFADKPLEIYGCGKATGKFASPSFLYPELGEIDPEGPRAERVATLARILTNPKNGRLSRTMVNRLWAVLMGRGIVEPVDDMDQVPWNSDLLDWLAADLENHGYDLKRTLRLICTSRAYQMHATKLPAQAPDPFVFAGPMTRRMSAEQFVDAVCALTRTTPGDLAARITVPGAGSAPLPRWIWADKKAARSAPLETVFFRKRFMLKSPPKTAPAVTTCDNEFILFVNGRHVTAGKDWNRPVRTELAKRLRAGPNVIAVQATNIAAGPAGFAFRMQLGEEILMSDDSWLVTRQKINGWEKLTLKTEGWQHASVLGAGDMKPWSLAGPLGDVRLAISGVRASLVNDDPLSRALGRPNREQVVTQRDSLATTLQALELTNGDTLGKKLKSGARYWMSRADIKSAGLVDQVYREALGRTPSREEAKVANELLGQPTNQQSIEDLLWIITMLPDFQLIR